MGMRRIGQVVMVVAWSALAPAIAADLTAAESRWMRGIEPVVTFSREARMPLDIVVQPQAASGSSPLALGFVSGRCKLVFSMRDNPEAEAMLGRIPPDLQDAALELIAAHEVGHCRRYLDGAWHGVPAGFVAAIPEGLSPEVRAELLAQQAARREEGYGDLVGLAWVQQRWPQQYAGLYAWLVAERTKDLTPGSAHDTLAWLRLAVSGLPDPGASIFDSAAVLWAAGLVSPD
jgi:hypothetical protein